MNEYDRITRLKEYAVDLKDKKTYELFIAQYNDPKWDDFISWVCLRGIHPKTSPLAIKLAKRLYEDLGIEVFPIIFRTYAKWNLKTDGAFSWTMSKDMMHEIGGCERASEYIKKKYTLDIDYSWHDTEIILNKN